jgi:hypothetical protein
MGTGIECMQFFVGTVECILEWRVCQSLWTLDFSFYCDLTAVFVGTGESQSFWDWGVSVFVGTGACRLYGDWGLSVFVGTGRRACVFMEAGLKIMMRIGPFT